MLLLWKDLQTRCWAGVCCRGWLCVCALRTWTSFVWHFVLFIMFFVLFFCVLYTHCPFVYNLIFTFGKLQAPGSWRRTVLNTLKKLNQQWFLVLIQCNTFSVFQIKCSAFGICSADLANSSEKFLNQDSAGRFYTFEGLKVEVQLICSPFQSRA